MTPDGTALIAYAAWLRWRAVRLRFASVFLSDPGAPAEERSAWSGVSPPETSPDRIAFAHTGLAFEGEWTRTSPAVASVLLDDDEGRVEWEALVPGARASARVGDRVLHGLGYVERLTFTRPPWSLPLRTLRWGRFVSEAHALVWIDWAGGPPRRWTWFDGRARADAVSDDAGVREPGGGLHLQFQEGRTLLDRRALQVLARGAPALDTLPMGPLAGLRETKRLDRARLHVAGADIDRGWALHEVVTW